MIEVVVERDPIIFYREVLDCEPAIEEDNDIQTLLLSFTSVRGIQFQAQYYGDDDVWTPPLPLTRERIAMLLDDDSVSCLKLIIQSKL